MKSMSWYYNMMCRMLEQDRNTGEVHELVRHTEVMISQVLRAGVLLSAGVIVIGVLDGLLRYRHSMVSTLAPSSPSGMWLGLSHGDPSAIISLGLVLLLATPVVRVAVSIVAFGIEHDRLYMGITALVLAILLLSLLSGLGGS